MRSLVVSITSVALSLLCGACPLQVDILNAAPRVTWVAVQPPVDAIAEVTVWVSDQDGDPVDLEAGWMSDGSSAATPLELEPGGHGTVGLTTHEALFDPNGQPHLLLWDTTDAAASASVRLVFVPDDQESGRGWEARSPAFGLADGLPEPVEVEWIEP